MGFSDHPCMTVSVSPALVHGVSDRGLKGRGIILEKLRIFHPSVISLHRCQPVFLTANSGIFLASEHAC